MSNTSLPRAVQFEESENEGSNTSANPTMGDIIAARMSRRDLLTGVLAVSAISAVALPIMPVAAAEAAKAGEITNTTPSFRFTEVAAGSDMTHHVADGYDADILIRWGDKVLSDAPEFDPNNQSAAAQAKQFGYNNDFIGFWPLDANGDRGLLVINHEYTNEELMFPGIPAQHTKEAAFKDMTPDLVAIEMMAHGGSVLEIVRINGKWAIVENSKYARRITADTEIRISGPAAGHAMMKTSADPQGTTVRGMLNNCAGAMTPWGTWLTCEENFNGYFWGKDSVPAGPEGYPLRRYGVPGHWYNWGTYHDRFDVAKEPNEPNRFGWVVEIDPMDPASVPVKRTALGRFKHEGAANLVNKDGRFVVYQGDDERNDYVYKFVTEGKVDTVDAAANRDLLDRGTLYVARFENDGTGLWLPLVHGTGPLTTANGFAGQGDILIHTRLASDLLGATKMDRPEDVEANPKTGKVYVILTNNEKRAANEVDASNPRAANLFGHIIEMTPEDGDHAATAFRWEMLVRCGDPSIAAVGATFNPATSKDGWFGMPDNCAFDAEGRLWISTDGNNAKATGRTDGVWAMETEGAARGTAKLFYRVPVGAEMCGPEMTASMTTFFLAVQHPGESTVAEQPSTFDSPATRWPDFKDGMPPRPAIVAITKRGGGKIAA